MYKIVIIDDEEKIAEGIANLFPWEQMGFSVAAFFQSGKKALQYIETHPVDVLVSDIEMPDLSGLALCEHLAGSPGGDELGIPFEDFQGKIRQGFYGISDGSTDEKGM